MTGKWIDARAGYGFLLFAIISLSCSLAFGQATAGHQTHSKEFCSGNDFSSDGRASFSELRETTAVATGSITVNGGKNGGVRVAGSGRSDILVRACVQTWGATEAAARADAGNIKIDTGSEIKADGPDESNWSVSFEVLVPRNTNLKLSAHNGGIAISGVEGDLEFETTNGGVSLSNVAGSVRGRTTNGGVNVALSGNTWRGSGLDVTTSNGGVKLSIPESYSATIETATVNGGFKSDIPALNVTTENVIGERFGRNRGVTISTAINGGGPTVRVVTTNGGINISSTGRKVPE